MLLSVWAGVDHHQLLRTLEELGNQAHNLRAVEPGRRHTSYFQWTGNAVRMLRHALPPIEIDRLLLTRRYWMLQSLASPSADLVDLEIEERIMDLAAARAGLSEQMRHWAGTDLLIVGDTSMYLSPALPKLEDLVIADVLQLRHNRIRLLVPVIVLDELDNLKDRGQDHARWRAKYTLALLDRLLKDPEDSRARLQPEDYSPLETHGMPRGEVTIEILFDPPGHERMSINDDEIIDRAVAAGAVAGRPVTLVTGDTGQSMRGRAAGLEVYKIPREPEGDEPAMTRRASKGAATIPAP